MRYEDRERLIDYTEEFPDKDFILCIPKDYEELNWEMYKAYSEKVNFMLCIDNLKLASECHYYGIKFYWSYPCFTWYELRSLIALEPCYITLNAPLSFELDKIQQATNIPVRLCPNLAYDAYIPRENGIYGTWVRPEDTEVYGAYVDVFEFEAEDLNREAALLHIYKDNKEWPGNLNLLITNLNYNIDNRSIDEDLANKRVKCGQRCMRTETCHLCETCFKLGNKIRELHYENLKAKRQDTV